MMLVAVNMTKGRLLLQDYFAKLLKKTHKGRQGRLALRSAESTAKYPLFRNFSQHNLREMLKTYDAWSSNQHLPSKERLTLWEIGESIRLVGDAMPKKDDTKYITTNKHNVMSVAVSRYVKNAKAIIGNTSKGQFPNSTL
jgi:hypothetical protein